MQCEQFRIYVRNLLNSLAQSHLHDGTTLGNEQFD